MTFVDLLYLMVLNILYDDIHGNYAKGIVIRAKYKGTMNIVYLMFVYCCWTLVLQ